jgi:predicted transcriptional regulator YheO
MMALMTAALQVFVPVAESIALLLRPHAEVVIHDLAKGTVFHIANAFSKRRPGDSSLTELEEVRSLDLPVIGPYRKTNWDGRSLKSSTAALRDGNGHPAGLLCINLDVSLLETIGSAAREFLRFADQVQRPAALFKGDWQDEINSTVGQFLTERGVGLASLSAEERRALVTRLNERGLFAVRNAAPYIARILNSSRSSLYKTLKNIRSDVSRRVTDAGSQ